jgi:hypothetical protein
MVADATITGGKVEVAVERAPTSAVQVELESFRSPKMKFSPDSTPLQEYIATSPVAVKGRVPVKGEQIVPSASSTSHAQFAGVELGVSAGGSGFVNCKTKLDEVSVPAGFAPQASVVVESTPNASGILKQGSLIALPTLQRQASDRYGAATELAKQLPFSTGVEVAGVVGIYSTTWVAGELLPVCPLWLDEFKFEYAKNWPKPKIRTRRSTTIIRTLRLVSDILIKT